MSPCAGVLRVVSYPCCPLGTASLQRRVGRALHDEAFGSRGARARRVQMTAKPALTGPGDFYQPTQPHSTNHVARAVELLIHYFIQSFSPFFTVPSLGWQTSTCLSPLCSEQLPNKRVLVVEGINSSRLGPEHSWTSSLCQGPSSGWGSKMKKRFGDPAE